MAHGFFGAKEPFGSIRSSYVPPGTWHMVFLELRNLSEVFVPHTFLQAHGFFGAKEPFGSIRSSYVPPGKGKKKICALRKRKG
jgi:hypothetical protein